MPRTRRYVRTSLLTLALLALAPDAAAQPRSSNALPLAEYLAELDRIDTVLGRLDARAPDDAARLAAGLPSAWAVIDDGRTFFVSADWLRIDLNAWRLQPDAAIIAHLTTRLRALRAEGEAARTFSQPDLPAARDALAAILATDEFQSVRGEGWFERARQRVIAWIVDALGVVVGQSMVPTVTRWLIYAVMAIAAIGVALALHRALRRAIVVEALGRPLPPQPVQAWPSWLEDAQSAAARGDWREAIRRAYWCGVVYLESDGAWRADTSRTPREHLRLLNASDRRLDALIAFTGLLERVWYGTAAADESRYDEARALLEQLGCPSR